MLGTINIGGKLWNLAETKLMAIVNATDDSFYAQSQCGDEEKLLLRADKALRQGADLLDIGGCSTRPQGEIISAEVEWSRVNNALGVIKANFPNALLSLDTFRPQIAQQALNKYGHLIVNDVSGLHDERMAKVVAEAGVPYVLTHSEALGKEDDLIVQVLDFFCRKIDVLQRAGVKDIIIDPGFGFNKTTEQNWRLLSSLDHLKILSKPILVGISRKRMLQQLLGCTANKALNGTTAANMVALQKGADMLRVHDVRAAKEVIMVYNQTK